MLEEGNAAFNKIRQNAKQQKSNSQQTNKKLGNTITPTKKTISLSVAFQESEWPDKTLPQSLL